MCHLPGGYNDKLFEEMMLNFEHFDEAMGNIYRFRGNLQFHQGFAEEARKLATQLERLRTHWQQIQIEPPARQNQEPYRVGDFFQVRGHLTLP